MWGRQLGGREGAAASRQRLSDGRIHNDMQGVKMNNKQENSLNHCRVDELMHTDSIVHQERQ